MKCWMETVGNNELWSLVVSEVGALDVAVGGCRESETDVVDMLVHPGVRTDVVHVGAMVKWLAEGSE